MFRNAQVGSSAVEKVDVRFVCATNKDPWEEVEKGNFREDLYFRLHVIPIHLPPLRDRGEDILDIAGKFLTEFAGEEGKEFQTFDDETAAILAAFPWPGNVRQLQNVIRNVVVLHDGEVVTADMLPSPLGAAAARSLPPAARPGPAPREPRPEPAPADREPVIRPLWQVEQELINAAISQCDGNVSRAAALLELSPSTVYRRLREAEEKAEGGSDAAE